MYSDEAQQLCKALDDALAHPLLKHDANKPHGPGTNKPGQKPHGKWARGMAGKQTLAAIIRAADLSLGVEGVPSRDQILRMDDEGVWNEAARLAGSEEQLSRIIERLPERGQGENLNVDDLDPEMLQAELKGAGAGKPPKPRLATQAAGEPEPEDVKLTELKPEKPARLTSAAEARQKARGRLAQLAAETDEAPQEDARQKARGRLAQLAAETDEVPQEDARQKARGRLAQLAAGAGQEGKTDSTASTDANPNDARDAAAEPGDPEALKRFMDAVNKVFPIGEPVNQYEAYQSVYKDVYNPTGAPKQTKFSQEEYEAALLDGPNPALLDRSWAHFYGSETVQDLIQSNPAQIQRFYFNLQPDYAPEFMQELTQQLENAGIPYQAKVARKLDKFNRSDAAVLYIDSQDQERVSSIVNELADSSKYEKAFADEVPGLTKKLRAGIATAQEPNQDIFRDRYFSGQVSFGSSHALVVAEALSAVSASPEQDSPEARLEYVRNLYKELGLDPDRPWLNGTRTAGAGERKNTDAGNAERFDRPSKSESRKTKKLKSKKKDDDKTSGLTFTEGNAEDYYRGLTRIDEEFPGFVTIKRRGYYRSNPNVRVFTTEDGSVGYSLTDHGDGRIEVAGVFNYSGERGAGAQALREAVAQGANYLEAYDGFLPFNYFDVLGAIPTERWAWDDQYRHPKWQESKFGTPGVMMMDIPRPEDRESESYEERRKKFLDAYEKVGGGEGVPEAILEKGKKRLQKNNPANAGFKSAREFAEYMLDNPQRHLPDVFS